MRGFICMLLAFCELICIESAISRRAGGNRFLLRPGRNRRPQNRGHKVYNRKKIINCGDPRIILNGGESESIISPNYPADFKTSSNCVWKIKTEPGYRIQLTVEDLVLPSCKHLLMIESSFGRPLPIRECGMIIGIQNFISDHNYMIIKFKASYHGKPERGFNITVRSVKTACDVNLCQNGGTCATTKYSFECLCPNNTSGLLCEHILDPFCFNGAAEKGIFTCCNDIEDQTKCEIEPTCTYLKVGCLFDCSAFSNNPDVCNIIPSCVNIPELGDICTSTVAGLSNRK